MKRSMLAIATIATLTSAPALAQFYGSPHEPPPPAYGRRFPDEPYSRPYDPYGPRRGYQRRAQTGAICVTSRGNCRAEQRLPLNYPCRCYIPGFGSKRGAIGY